MPIPQEATNAPVQDLQAAFSSMGVDSALTLLAFLMMGGLLALYVRVLYARTSRSASADSISRVFPLLTMVTIAVISVVKSSLSLSLGLVGALSIVRFRAAIRDPEELVYLFLCIGIGLSLGAAQPWLAVVLVAAATVFVLVFDRLRPSYGAGDALLTVIGPAARFGDGEPGTALVEVQNAWSDFVVQRCEIDADEGQLRVQLRGVRDEDAPRVVAKLRASLPDCHVSFVNAGVLSH
jgi:hypothetical protein